MIMPKVGSQTFLIDDLLIDYTKHCVVCPKINNCNHRRCTSESDNLCEWCEGEISPKINWRAYTPYTISTRKLCNSKYIYTLKIHHIRLYSDISFIL